MSLHAMTIKDIYSMYSHFLIIDCFVPSLAAFTNYLISSTQTGSRRSVTDVSENCRRADACDANSSANSASMNSQVEAFETRDPHLFDTNVMRISRSIICLVICFCWQQNRVAHAWTFDVKPSSSRRQAVTAGEPNAVSRDRFLQTAFQSSIAAVLGVNLLSQSPANAIMTDPKTGIALPSPGEIETAIPSDWNDIENPFIDGDKSQFARLDSSSDSLFYADPRFVEHVDDNAVKTMTRYVSNDAITNDNDTVLDLCSSWTSHIDSSIIAPKSVVGLGMNEKELKSNPSLTSWNVQDLNVNPKLPYADNSFSVVLCQLSIDYLTKPLQVLKEVGRVLKPGGTIHVLFSNRLFLSKVRFVASVGLFPH
jgi:hypothetical protein